VTAFAALVALVIRREPFGGPLWVEIGSRRQVGMCFAVPLVEPFHHDGPGRHVDAQGQRFGGGRRWALS
jgi:hypothetical protein